MKRMIMVWRWLRWAFSNDIALAVIAYKNVIGKAPSKDQIKRWKVASKQRHGL